MARATKSKLSLIDFQRRFEDELNRQLPNPQDSTPEEIKAVVNKIGTSIGVRRLKVNFRLECKFKNGKRECEFVLEIIRE